MESINRNEVQQRIGLVYDTMAGAQLQSKGIGKYVRALREAVGLQRAQASETSEFLRDFGKGI
jgi:hypothetical protein